MSDVHISFYLRANRIHVFINALRGIGSPRFICFMLDETGRTLAITPYPRKDFHSHRVAQSVYQGEKDMEISSHPLCSILTKKLKWNTDSSYRVPGMIFPKQRIAVFYLDRAEVIARDGIHVPGQIEQCPRQ